MRVPKAAHAVIGPHETNAGGMGRPMLCEARKAMDALLTCSDVGSNKVCPHSVVIVSCR